MRQISIKTKIPYFCLTVDFNRLREMNSNPEEWARFLSKIRSHIEVSVEDEPNFFADIDYALLDIMRENLGSDITRIVYKQKIELRLESHTLYIIFKCEQQRFNVNSEEYV